MDTAQLDQLVAAAMVDGGDYRVVADYLEQHGDQRAAFLRWWCTTRAEILAVAPPVTAQRLRVSDDLLLQLPDTYATEETHPYRSQSWFPGLGPRVHRLPMPAAAPAVLGPGVSGALALHVRLDMLPQRIGDLTTVALCLAIARSHGELTVVQSALTLEAVFVDLLTVAQARSLIATRSQPTGDSLNDWYAIAIVLDTIAQSPKLLPDLLWRRYALHEIATAAGCNDATTLRALYAYYNDVGTRVLARIEPELPK